MSRLVHIPTALSRREDAVLQLYARDKQVVEAGALLGHSTVILGDVARQVISIDHHKGYDALPNDTWRDFHNNIHRYGVADKIVPITGDYRLLETVPAEFAFIDLDGLYSTTLRALKMVQAPIVAVHDYQRQNCPGVEEAVHVAGYPIICRIDSLVVLRKQ